MGQINSFPIETRNPEDTPVTKQTLLPSDKIVLQNGTTPKAMLVSEALKLFAPKINNTPISYVPTTSGNTSNLNEVVIASNGKKYLIDIYGNATLHGVESKGRYSSIDNAIENGLSDGDFFTINNINHPLHGSLMEVII